MTRLTLLAILATAHLSMVFDITSVAVAADATAKASVEIPATDDGLPGAGPIRRYDWFRNLWTQKRSGWAGRVEMDQKALVFLGDSITQGWGDDFKGSFSAVKVANRGRMASKVRKPAITRRRSACLAELTMNAPQSPAKKAAVTAAIVTPWISRIVVRISLPPGSPI